MAHKMKHTNKTPAEYWIGQGTICRNVIEGNLEMDYNYKKKTKAERVMLKLLKSRHGNVKRGI
jgi:hypothetical protein